MRGKSASCFVQGLALVVLLLGSQFSDGTLTLSICVKVFMCVSAETPSGAKYPRYVSVHRRVCHVKMLRI